MQLCVLLPSRPSSSAGLFEPLRPSSSAGLLVPGGQFALGDLLPSEGLLLPGDWKLLGRPRFCLLGALQRQWGLPPTRLVLDLETEIFSMGELNCSVGLYALSLRCWEVLLWACGLLDLAAT